MGRGKPGMTEIPQGYKNTEIGIIPDNWEVTLLGHLSRMKSGQGITSASIEENGDYPCYGGNGLRGFTKTYTHEGIFPLIGRQGALCGNVTLARGRFYASEHAVVVTPNQGVDAEWLSRILAFMNLNSISEASAQGGLAVSKILKLEAPFPQNEEQRAIATALADVDALIEAKRALLEKKRAIKQGTMQELLTGNRRLPGFPVTPMKHTEIGDLPEDWEVKTLGEIGVVKMCKRIFKHETSAEGDVPFFKIGTFGQQPDAYISREKFNAYRSIYPYPQKGTPLISAAGTIGRVVVYDGQDAYYQDSNIVWLEHEEKDILNAFLRYYYSVINWVTETGSAITRLYNNNILSSQVALPTLREQSAIASTLDDMDLEVAALEQELKKLVALKQGMMQNLLTGRIRLV